MSLRPKSLGPRLRARLDGDEGFSLVEVIVALMLLALASAAVVPVLVVGGRAAVSARFEGDAKNFAQERLEQMRQLPVHVSRDNGQYVDVLDRYYPNLVPATGTGTGWVLTGPRLPGEPTSGPLYRTVIPPTAATPRLTQVVAVQFLDLNRAPVAEARFSTYDSQVAGRDEPPSRFLGVTVITTWTDAASAKSSVVTSQISAAGRTETVLAAQARAVALRVQSAGADGAAMTGEVASVAVDGQLSDAATASAQTLAGRVTRANAASVEAAKANAVAPATSPAAQPGLVDKDPVPTSGCGYAAFGRSRVDQVTSSVSTGQPLVPATVGTATTPAYQTSALLRPDAGGACGAFWFDNDTNSSDSRLKLDSAAPLASISGSVAGAPAPLQASGWTTATSEGASPRFVRAGGSASGARSIELFKTTYAGGQPLLWVTLVSSSIVCDSRTPGAATASYRVTIDYRDVTGLRLPLADFTWSSATGPTIDPLAGVSLTTKIVGMDGVTPLTLADYISSWSFGRTLAQGASNGISSLDAALQITTQPIRSSDSRSSVGITVGSLSCAATDNR